MDVIDYTIAQSGTVHPELTFTYRQFPKYFLNLTIGTHHSFSLDTASYLTNNASAFCPLTYSFWKVKNL